MRTAGLLIALCLAPLALPGPAGAGPVALVLSVEGQTRPGLLPFEELQPGTEVAIGQGGSAEIHHYRSCTTLALDSGSTVAIGATALRRLSGPPLRELSATCDAVIEIGSDSHTAGQILRGISALPDFAASPLGPAGGATVPGDAVAGSLGILAGAGRIAIGSEGGTRLSAGAGLTMDLVSPIAGHLVVYEIGPEPSLRQLFPNERTRKLGVRSTLAADRRFRLPNPRHGFRLTVPPPSPGARRRTVLALVTQDGSPLERLSATRGLGQVHLPGAFLAMMLRLAADHCVEDSAACAVGVFEFVITEP